MLPENLEIANTYLTTMSHEDTARQLGIALPVVESALNNKEIKRYIDNVFLQQGYINRFKLQATLSSLIDKKLAELSEAEIGSSKDIADLLMMAHKVRMDELKHQTDTDKLSTAAPTIQNNFQQVNNYGQNYNDLLNKILEHHDNDIKE